MTARAASTSPSPLATTPAFLRASRAIGRAAITYGLPFGTFLLLWELWSDAFGVPQLFPSPRATAHTYWQIVADGTLPFDALTSITRIVIGFVIGSVLGALGGLVIGTFRLAREVLEPWVNFLRFISGVAWISIFIVWFGIGETPKVALIAFATIFPVYLNLYSGIRSVDLRLLDAAKSFGLSRADQIWHVVLPSALPSLLVGLRYALSVSILVLVVAEQINASAGLGYLINNARDFMRTDIIVVCLMVYAILGLGADWLVRAIEARALIWRPSIVEQ